MEHGRRALIPLLGRIERELRSRGIATFDFLLAGAEALLADQPDVRRQVRRRIDQLLVDEFQDTDRIQCDLLRWIALDGPAEERPGLFLVGDPKQSIYGWRNADLRAYDGFVALVLEAGGEVMSLALNFRSVPVILEEVARVIEPVMTAREGVQPAFEPLLACDRRLDDPGFLRARRRLGRLGARRALGLLEAPGGALEDPVIEATEIEAAALADDIRALHEQHRVAWSEIAVLLRGIGDLDLYLEAFRRARVPFAVGRDKQYYRRREVIEAAALVRSVLDPGDHLALLTVLRSATVGVPDAALIPLWNRQLPQLMTELRSPAPDALAALKRAIEGAVRALPKDVPGIDRVRGWDRNLLAAVENLADLRHCFETQPADVFVERLRRLTLVEATEAARYLGPYRLANLERFFRQVLAAVEESGGDATAILRALRRSVSESRDAEEGRPKEGAEDAVQVLTIHGAKGLDFEHVYLVQLHKASPGDRNVRTEAGRWGDGFEFRLFGAPTPGFDRIEAERRVVEAAERVRLLYVAMTRAKDRVVLTGLWPARVRPRPWDQVSTTLELLHARRDLPESLPDLWDEALGNAGEAAPSWSFPDPTGALWKFPALRPPADLSLAAEPERPSLPGPEEIAFVSATLRAERERAGRPHGPPLRRRRLRGGPRPPARAAGRAPGRDRGDEPRPPPPSRQGPRRRPGRRRGHPPRPGGVGPRRRSPQGAGPPARSPPRLPRRPRRRRRARPRPPPRRHPPRHLRRRPPPQAPAEPEGSRPRPRARRPPAARGGRARARRSRHRRDRPPLSRSGGRQDRDRRLQDRRGGDAGGAERAGGRLRAPGSDLRAGGAGGAGDGGGAAVRALVFAGGGGGKVEGKESWYTAEAMTIPDRVLESARMSEPELRLEIAVLLYEKEKLTLAQASRLAEMGRLQFQHLLASRGLLVHYGVEDFEQDLDTLRGLGRL